MRQEGSNYNDCWLGRGEPEEDNRGSEDTWGQHGHFGGDSTQRQPRPNHCRVYQQHGAYAGLDPSNHNVVGHVGVVADSCIAESTGCHPQSTPPLRSPSFQSVDMPYNTMVSLEYILKCSRRDVFLHLQAKKKYTFVWQCCMCGTTSIPYRNNACPRCRYDRCGNCAVTKVQLK
jgi:hypothetical protein